MPTLNINKVGKIKNIACIYQKLYLTDFFLIKSPFNNIRHR